MEKQIDLSIVIPFYNGENFISGLLTSLINSYNLIDQDKLQPEVLLIVDSMATSVYALQYLIDVGFKKLNISISKNEHNLGVAATRNAGINVAKGEYIYFVDQDDQVFPDFFLTLIRRSYKHYEFILFNGTFFNDKKRYKIYYLKPALNIKNLITDDFIRSPGQVIIKKEILNSGVRFPVPKNHFGSDDKFFYIKLFKAVSPKVLYINDPLYRANIHSDNYSNNTTESALSSIELLNDLKATTTFNDIEQGYIQRNSIMLLYLLGKLEGIAKFKGFICYLQYKIRLNKLIRYIIRAFQL